MRSVLTGILLSCASIASAQEADTAKVFTVADQMPQFPGGEDVLQKYIKQRLIYPKYLLAGRLEGIVITAFTVNTDGTITDVGTVKDIGSGSAEEAIRLIAGMPPWQPGIKDGKAVKVRTSLPITFRIPNK